MYVNFVVWVITLLIAMIGVAIFVRTVTYHFINKKEEREVEIETIKGGVWSNKQAIKYANLKIHELETVSRWNKDAVIELGRELNRIGKNGEKLKGKGGATKK